MKKMMTLMLAGCVTLLAAQAFAADPKKEFVGSDACKNATLSSTRAGKRPTIARWYGPKRKAF